MMTLHLADGPFEVQTMPAVNAGLDRRGGVRLRYKLLALLLAAGAAYGAWLRVAEELTDDYGMTGLMRAAAASDESRLGELLARGAHVNRQVASDDLEAFIALLGFFQAYPANKVGRTALMFAVESADSAVVARLLDEGADPNRVARGNDTALLLAVQRGAPELVRLLLQHGANPDGGGGQHLASPLLFCASGLTPNGPEIAGLLIAAGANLNLPTPDGETPLILAVRSGNLDVVRQLVAASADPAARDSKAGWTARMWAVHLIGEAEGGRGRAFARHGGDGSPGRAAEILRVLEQAGGPEIGAADLDFQLVRAVLAPNPEAVTELLAQGASPNAHNEQSEPVAFLAARAGQPAMVRALLAAGAGVHIEFHSSSLLASAVAGRSPEVVRAVLDARPGSRHLQDALRQAAVYGQTDIVRLLLAGGASPDMGEYPLLEQSIQHGNAEVVQLLLEAGADPNLKGRGQSALGAAVTYGKVDVVRALLAAGADPDIAGGSGKTPRDYAEGIAAKESFPEDYRAKYREISAMMAAAKPRP